MFASSEKLNLPWLKIWSWEAVDRGHDSWREFSRAACWMSHKHFIISDDYLSWSVEGFLLLTPSANSGDATECLRHVRNFDNMILTQGLIAIKPVTEWDPIGPQWPWSISEPNFSLSYPDEKNIWSIRPEIWNEIPFSIYFLRKTQIKKGEIAMLVGNKLTNRAKFMLAFSNFLILLHSLWLQ